MRLLFAANVANRESTGMGGWTHRIAEVLRRQGHAVELWFAEDFAHPLARLDPLLFPVRLAERLVRRAANFDVAVVHEPSGFWCAAARRLSRALPPIVAMSHGIESRAFDVLRAAWAREDARVGGSLLRNRLVRRWQSDGTLRLADHVLCLSSFDANYLERSLGAAPDKVTAFCNGVAADEFIAPGKRDGDRVLFIGGWLDYKGRCVLPRIWAEVARQVPSARLTLVGTGASAEEVLGAFPEALRPAITVVPRIERREALRAQLRDASVFLMPSLFEGSPLALLEALAAGLPAVATRVGGIPDLVRDREHALLFEPEEASRGAALVVDLLRNPEQAATLGARGRERARALTWEKAAEAVLGACERARAAKGRR